MIYQQLHHLKNSKNLQDIIIIKKKTVKRGYSKKQVEKVYKAAEESIGVEEGIYGTKIQIKMYIEEAEMLKKQIKMTEEELEKN